jgi:Mg-chelatase subunit ChlD
LYEAANVGWRANVSESLHLKKNVSYIFQNNNQTFNEKLVVLITDGAPNGLFTPLIGQDPWVISNRFMEQDITLVVVGVEESVVVCDDFYCALAKNTGMNKFSIIVNHNFFFSDFRWRIHSHGQCRTHFSECYLLSYEHW